MASELERAAARWLDALGRRDSAVARELTAHYAAAQRSIAASVRHALRRQQALEQQGRGVSYRFNRGRLEALRRLIEDEVAGLTGQAAATIDAGRRAAAQDAVDWSRRFVREQLGPGAALVELRRHTVEAAVAAQAEGSPLRTLLTEFGQEGGDRVGRAISAGLATGANPLVVARRIAKDVTQTYRGRAQLIARTEMMRAVRHATRETFRADRDVLGGWCWWSSCDRTTCAACWAMHGTTHTVDELLDGHPGCRCTMVPLVVYPGIRPPDIGPTGPEMFAQLDPETQLAILGPGRFGLYQGGHLRLQDMVEQTHSARWGSMRRVASIKRSLDAAASGTQGKGTVGAVVAKLAAATPNTERLVSVGSLLSSSGLASADATAGAMAIRAVHGLIRLPARTRGVPISTATAEDFRSLAAFERHLHRNTPIGIDLHPDLNASSPVKANLLVHEIGHWIDWTAFTAPTARQSASSSMPEFSAWRAAVARSREYQRLKTTSLYNSNEGYREYLLRARELWARSFAQWVALRSGRSTMMDGIHQHFGGVPQWPDQDFREIAGAIDALFQSRGWLR